MVATSVVFSAGKTTEVVTASDDSIGADTEDAVVLLEDNTAGNGHRRETAGERQTV